MRSFADQVDGHRRRRRLTQAALAQRVGVTQPTLAEWLSGRRPVPTARLRRLVEVLGLRGAARNEVLVTAWLSAAPPPVAHLLRGLLRQAGQRQVGRLVSQALTRDEMAPPRQRPPETAPG